MLVADPASPSRRWYSSRVPPAPAGVDRARRRGGARGRRAGRARAARSRPALRRPRRRPRSGARGSRGAGRACRAGRARSPPARRRGSPCSRAPRCRRASRAPRRMSAQVVDRRGDVVAVGRDDPALAGRDVLRRVEREAGRVRDRADLAAAVDALDRVRRVLDHRHARARAAGRGRPAGPRGATGRIAFVRGVTSSRDVLRVDVQVGRRARRRRPGVAPQWTTTFAVAGHVIGLVITSSPGPTPSATSARCIAAVPEATASACFAPRYSANRSLELRRPRAGRQPAGADRLRDRRDLLLADRGRLEPERFAQTRARLHRRVSKRTSSAARPARSSASLAAPPTASTAPARSAPRRSGPSTEPGSR